MDNVNSRRKFLKKAVYAVPTVVVLGSLKTPLNARSGSSNITTTGTIITTSTGITTNSSTTNQQDFADAAFDF